MELTYWCKYCGKEKSLDNDKNYRVGLLLAEYASFAAYGHTEDVTPIPICNDCAERVKKEWESR